MANKNAVQEISEIEVENEDSFDLDELEAKLQSNLDSQLLELDFLKEDREKIGNPDNLGNTVMDVVWEQFLNQMATTAGEDFIRENRGLTLDLRNEAHIQTTENFADGKIATHNDKIDFQKRYDDWQKNFKKDENDNIITRPDNRSGTDKPVLTKDARAPFDENRPKGSAAVHKDHTVPAAEIIRDPKANAHLDKQGQIDFANSDKNLKDMDAAANQSKGDSTMSEWVKSERDGKKPTERFNIPPEEELMERERIAREEFEKRKEEGEKRSIETGKQSQREEAFRISGKALRTVVMQLLAELIKTVIRKLILWFKSAQKTLESLLESLKSAIITFASDLKKHLINAGSALITTIATAIFGPIIRTVKRVWTILKQGWRSLKEAIAYLKNPANKNKPIGIVLLEVGKIVVAGLSALGAIVLGELIEKGLMAIPALAPIFAFEIPILGSLASLLGLFLGGLIAGIIGAIAMSLIDKAIIKQQMAEAVKKEVNKGNEILVTQTVLIALNEKKLEQTKDSVGSSISKRHEEFTKTTKDVLDNIFCEEAENETVVSGNEAKYDNLLGDLDKLE